ncbi:CBS domain-containing protein [Bdellovibrio sp. SKB1291214]|uniref:CBS domain-containing protein n=1 Tax=Bdellovibrio sp. SKB1291214 TaxID=1732569 RepID=UPI000B51571A|nr:CBS domain-containing protein [Bdellovibrio sp. SKB1291214]UYL08585.1 CBS domain-containing protein [Bdellovibrio sp. SKB1291214]
MAKLARDVMTNNVIMVSAGTTLADAHKLMKNHHIRHLPIVDKDQRIMGVLSERDILKSANIYQSHVEEMMSQPVVWMAEDEPINSAVEKMLEKKISSVLVGNSEDQLIGIVTTDDLLQLLAQSLDKVPKKQPLSTLFDIESLDEIAYKISQTGI